jgi:hypothetical protein
MRLVLLLLSFCLILPISVTAQVQPPAEFALYQNDPNPFCPALEWTNISMDVATEVQVSLQMWSPDTTTVIRTLLLGVLPVGRHSVAWDGRDTEGSPVSHGRYPYIMTAGNPPEVTFADTLVAAAGCDTPTGSWTWGWLKTRYVSGLFPSKSR